MIICSCNVISDKQVFSVVAGARLRSPPISQVYAGLGCRARCGRCVPAVKKLRDEAFISAGKRGAAGHVEL